MSDLSRRKLIKGGWPRQLGLRVSCGRNHAKSYGLIPPDHGGPLGCGETLNYASTSC